jgi:MFS family permease
VAAQNIMPDLQLSPLQIGWLNAAFATCYALAQLPGGIVGQKYGGRLTLTMVGLFGLIATLATPLAPMVLGGTALFVALLAVQGLLGLSQGPVFPMVAAVLQTWFPQRQWAVTNGMNSLGANIGGAMTAPLVVVLTLHFGWQGALLWHPRVTAAELAELDASDLQKPPPMTLARLRRIVGQRDVQLLAFSYFCLNYVFYLLGTWSFLYLVQERDFHGLESGFAGMLPWIGAGIGAGVGGFLSDGLAARIGFRWGYRLVPLFALPAAGLLLLVTISVTSQHGEVLAGDADGHVLRHRTERGGVLGRLDARRALGHRRRDRRDEHRRQPRRHGLGADHRRAVRRGQLERDVRDRRGVRLRCRGLLVRDRPGPAGDARFPGGLTRSRPRALAYRSPIRDTIASRTREPLSPLVKMTRPEPVARLNCPNARKPELFEPECWMISPCGVTSRLQPSAR